MGYTANKKNINMKREFFLDQFLKSGYINFGSILDKKKCRLISSKVLKSRPWNFKIFRSYNDIFKNPRHHNVIPKKNGYNLAEKFNLNFIEKNNTIKNILNDILGKNYECILKKFVVSVPPKIIPKYLKKTIRSRLDGHLAQYLKPKYRNISYFSGIDYHMDLLDYPNFDGDYITLYVYLTDVDNSQSPLKLVENSHRFGPTRFPHYLKKNKRKNSILYSRNGKKFNTFETTNLTGKSGSVYLWTALTLHGTKASTSTKPRVALRYSFKKKNKKKSSLINKVYKNLNKLSLKNSTRSDILVSKKSVKQLKQKRFLV